jgi:hypothetical protein
MTRVGVRKLGEIDGLGLEQVENGLNGRSGISARAGHRRSGDPGLWVRIKEQWADRGSEPPASSCLCERTPCQDPKSSGRRRVPRSVTSGREFKARGDVAQHREREASHYMLPEPVVSLITWRPRCSEEAAVPLDRP